ncbi:nucleoside/nucleotide kinase family protein [Streptomyces sp. NPDC001002]
MHAMGVQDLIEAARGLITPGRRRILGITGAPGSGKSTLGELLVSALGDQAVLVGLDGFHLANAELDRLGRRERKGAADTFDAAGYVNLLRRLASREDEVVYASLFDRSLEESIACAVPVPRDVPLVVTEGNYLLVDGPVWGPVRELLDECWYVEPGEDVRLDRLIARHMSYGRSADEAYERSHGSDQRNAELVRATRAAAHRIVRVPTVRTPPEPAEEATA